MAKKKKASKTRKPEKTAAPAPAKASSVPPVASDAASSALHEPAPAPATGAPKPPQTIIIDGTLSKRLRVPTDGQVATSSDIAKELRENPDYRSDFGNRVPDPDQLASSFELAAAWSREATHAKAWADYCEAERRFAWNHSLLAVDPLWKEFTHVASLDASIAEKYPSFAAFFGARKVAAKRGVATRRKNMKKKPAPTP